MSDVWFMLRDADRYLYHYTRARTAIDYILPRQTLRLSRFQSLNDPKETKEFRLSGAEWGDDLRPSTLDDLSTQLKRDWHVACFVSDRPDAVFDANSDLGAQQMQAMHECGHSRPRMWAQYADNHAGVCLVFEKVALANAFDTLGAQLGLKVYSGRVQYENAPVAPNLRVSPFTFSMNCVRLHGVEEAARRHGERFWRELFLNKNTDWSGEREFRWLLYGEHSGDVGAPINGCLRGILLGSEFPEKKEAILRRHAGALDVKIARMDWSNGIPQIQPMLPRA